MVKNFKLVILGPENSGKSALVTQFLDNRFVEDYEPTKISYARKSFGVLGQKVLLDFEEFGPDAQESFKEKCYKDADGFLIVFSVNDLKSFEEAQEFREQIVKIRQDETIPFILVGNKVKRQVKVGQALAKATDWNVWYMETSAKTRVNVIETKGMIAVIETKGMIAEIEIMVGMIEIMVGQKGPMIEEVTEMIGTMTEEMVVMSVNSIIVTFVIKSSRVPKIWRITIELSIHLHLHPKICDKSWVPNGSGQKRAKIKVEQKFGGDDKKKKIVVAKTFLTAITAISHSIEY